MRVVLVLIFLTSQILSLPGASQDAAVSYCDDDWVDFNGFCYFVRDDVMATVEMAWKDCGDRDATLLTIETQEELQFLTGELADYHAAGWWTRMRRQRGTWLWSASWPVEQSLIAWSQEPNNAKGNENCGAVSEQMTFTDEPCDEKYGFLCEVNQEGCPMGFLIGNDRCLYVSDTYNVSQLMTKAQAQAFCKTLASGSQLANLDTADNRLFLSTVLPENAQTTTPWWVNIAKQNGQWVWGNGQPANPNWAKEPDNVNSGEPCVMLVNGKFADKSCDLRANYVCKKTDGSVPQTAYDGKYGCGSWIRAGKKCYFIQHMYGDTPDGASRRCRSEGADLLRIDSMDELTWVSYLALYYNTVFWTQLRSSNQGGWQNTDGSQPSSDILIWNQEPNDYMGKEDCVGINMKLKWNDLPCGQSGGYICEAASSNGGCPKNWVSNSAGRCYFFGPTVANASSLLYWKAAKAQCTALAEPLVGTLLALDDRDELDFVNSKLAARQSLGIFHWTALNDIYGEGILTYADNPNLPVVTSIIPWDKSPSCDSCNPACASLNQGGFFEDFACTKKQSYVCEKYATGLSGASSVTLSPVTLGTILFSSLIYSIIY